MASSASASNNLLETLLARPPTPPREARQATEVSLKAVLSRTPRDPRSSLQTPPGVNSPLSDGATTSNLSSKRTRKRVEWSPHTEYNEPPRYREGGKPNKSSPLSGPPSALSKPIKGILKPSPSPNHLASSLRVQLDGSADQPSITEMLDSTIKQLAGTDRDSRLDAYMMLARALKASNNLPDRVALQDKMSLFMQFIQRDVVSKNGNGSLDTSLINHALTLLTTFLHFQAIASTLTTDFGFFIIDHCIRSFDNSGVPKDIVRHLMQVVAFQNFSAKVMSLDRVGRLVASLHKLEDHLTGKSIVMGRIMIYKRLIKQSRNHMAVHTDWLKDMFTDMLSTVKDIRKEAILLGTDAGFALRNEKQVMRRVTEIFQTTDDDQVYIEYYIQKLQQMIKDKQLPSVVPQIWGVIILFLRCPLERWQYFGPWLTLAQSAFNTTDGQTKLEANYAWNRYAYLSLIDGKVVPKNLNLLTQPLNSQLKRKFNTKQPEEGMKLRKAVISGVCNLYYYAFRPNHDKSSTDVVWDLAVHPTMTQLIGIDGKPEVHKDSILQASRILAGLLDSTTPRGWKEERIMALPPVAPEELPSLDAKWIRRNSDKVFKLVGPILEKKFTDLANKESLTYRLWEALCGSIAAASAKDIKVSEETSKFTAEAFGILFKLWSQGCPDSEETLNAKFLPSVQNFVHVLVRALGQLPFTEKKLSMTVSNTFEPIATPSHRPDRADKSNGVVRAPLYHLLSILCSIPPGGSDDEVLSEFVQSVFEPFFNDRTTKGRVELAREVLRLLPRNTLSPYGPWILAARNLRLPLEQVHTPVKPNTPSSDRLLGPEYREIASLLERGLTSHPNLPSEQWFSLFDLLSQHVVHECGDAGRALGVIEPVAKMLLDNFFSASVKLNATSMHATSLLFDLAKLPCDRQAVEVARRRLWGAPPTAPRAQSFDPFDNLYKLGNQSLKFLYITLEDSGDEAAIASCIESLETFLVATFPPVGIKSLVRLQDGISPWIQDESAQLQLSGESSISKALRSLWEKICGQLVCLGRLEKTQYDQVEPLFTAAFKSKHRFVVNKMAETWNTIVKDEEVLECSDNLKSLVASLRPTVDLTLPGVEGPSGGFGAQVQSFVDSQDDLSFVALSSTKSSRQEVGQATPPVMSASKMALKGPITRKRRRDGTPEVNRAQPSERTSTPRLRHDNSQIQFAPIASSSPLAEESQHLTERQKEVRERQRETAEIYSSIRSGPKTRSRGNLAEESAELDTASIVQQQQATPTRATSYEDFISSTPTPRRGHALQMDYDNDPPSSPPEPRRNPLLSEIQSRSQTTTSSMEDWEFSSPPGSPATSHQQVEQGAEPQPIMLTDDSTQSKDHDHEANVPEDMEVIPSSVVEDERVPEEASKDTSNSNAKNVSKASSKATPKTPPHGASAGRKSDETPKSGEDEFVDARTSPVQMSPVDAPMASIDTSFALSEVDESSMMRLVAELESRRSNFHRDRLAGESFEEKPNSPVEDCITVMTDSSLSSPPPPEKSPKIEEKSASPTIPFTPAEVEPEVVPSGSQRKRKRGTKSFDTRRKKRQSTDLGETRHVDDGQPAGSDDGGSPGPSSRRSPRRVIGTRSRKQKSEVPQSQAARAAGTASGRRGVEDHEGDGDTDEELMSQLVTESFAASRSQSQADPDEGRSPSANSTASGSRKDKDRTNEERRSKEADSNTRDSPMQAQACKASIIMEKLRGGLNELRGATLSREEVYEMEDLLMDMKRELFAAESRGRR